MGGDHRFFAAAKFCTSVRDGTHDSPTPVDQGRYLVTSRHITGGQLDLAKAYLISDQDYAAVNKRSKVDRWDVLISMIGTVGEPYLVKEEPNYAIKNIGLFKSKGEFEGKWLFYYLQTPYAQQLIKEQSRGTTQQYIPLGALRDLPILVPEDRSEMQAIACILGTLDDKIELNRRMNRTLEAMARAIFKSWFVDFDPVRAKAKGGEPPGLSPHIAELFPDSFEDSEIGEIPKGWGVRNLTDEFKLIMGQSPPGTTYNEEGNGLSFFQGRRDFGHRYPTNRVYCTAPTRFADAGDTLVSVRAPVGDINMASERCCIGRGLSALRHRSGSRSYTYYAMDFAKDAFASFDTDGTVFGSISKKGFESILMVTPSDHLVAEYETIIFPFDERFSVNESEIRSLTAIRDTLLPRLISGELRVPDAECIVKRCV